MYYRFLVNALRLSILLLLGSAALCQTITASLQGRVTDNSGAILTKADVSAANTETGLTRSTQSDENGVYRIAPLPVGNYKVSVKAGTFQPQTRAIALTVGESATLDFSLLPARSSSSSRSRRKHR